MIKIYLFDDHEAIRDGLKSNLHFRDDISVIGDSDNFDETMMVITRTHPTLAADVVMVDINLTNDRRSGLELLDGITSQSPAVIVYSMYHSDEVATKALRSGAKGYVSKGEKSSEVIEAILQASRGKRYMTPGLQEMIMEGITNERKDAPSHDVLSKRELQIMIMLANGMMVTEIALLLHLSSKTVETHRANILDKMKMRNVADIARYAAKNNLV